VDIYGKLFENPSMHTKVMDRTRKSGWKAERTNAQPLWRLCRDHGKRAQQKSFNKKRSSDRIFQELSFMSVM